VALIVDGAYEYTAADLAAWDAEGPGSTFKRYYAPYEALARRYGLPLEAKPWCYDIAETQHWLGYVPLYSLRQALEELLRYGPAGPPVWARGPPAGVVRAKVCSLAIAAAQPVA